MNGIDLAKEPYELRQERSTVTHVRIPADLQALCAEAARHIACGTVILWQLHAVTWGRFEGGAITCAGGAAVEPLYWQELRIFDENAELHLVRRGDALVGRWRLDGEGEETSYVDNFSPLWGTRETITDGYAVLSDSERKLRMEIPVQQAAAYYGLVTRGYIVADAETGQAGYGDYRFVAIAPAEGGEQHG